MINPVNLKVAIVTEYLLGIGGADRVVKTLLQAFPRAEVFVGMYDKSKYPKDFFSNVKTTFLQRFYFGSAKLVNWLAPLAFENLDLSEFDLIISLSAGYSKGIIPLLNQTHIGIVLTPPRFLWGDLGERPKGFVEGIISFPVNILKNLFGIWDMQAFNRIDYPVAISQFVARQVYKVYRREVQVIYPGIEQFWFDDAGECKPSEKREVDSLGKFHLVVSRLHPYKRVDQVISTFLKYPTKKLLIIGSGPDMRYLKRLSNNAGNILFIENASDEQVRYAYSKAESFIFPGVEDFGLVMVEAMAQALPVIALNKGGASEIVEDSKSGALYNTLEELENILSTYKKEHFAAIKVKERATQFTTEAFLDKINALVVQSYENGDSKRSA